MKSSITTDAIVAFENDIAALFQEGKIRAPIHLRAGCEEQLIQIFKKIRPEDWIFNYWASHIHCLLKGVPAADLREAILQGKSISLCFPEQNIYCSGIVGSLAGVAVGTAWGLKRQKKKGTVYLFTGDMGAECGIFHESVKYAYNFDLPIKFVVEDNGVSVMSETHKVWGSSDPWFLGTKYAEKIIYFKYQNSWPHSGLGEKDSFLMKYFDEIKRTMEWAAQLPNVVFLGQAVGVPGTFMFNTLKEVPEEQRIELPVSESFQMQMTVGAAFSGLLPISVYPRLNFLMLAMGDMSNIVDKMCEIYPDKYPKLIIRSAVGPDAPVHPGHQHVGDFTEGFKKIFKNLEVIRLENPEDIFPAYEMALNPSNPKSYLMIEVGNYYNLK